MELHGHPFTWERGRNTDNWLEIRLDRALVSPDWLDLFPMLKLYTIDGSPSDHSPIFLDPKMIESIVKDNWYFNKDDRITHKVQQCGEKLEIWGRETSEEIFWRQRSKQLWLQSGDKNTRYFHSSCTARRRTNRIHRLKNDNGNWVDWQQGLQSLIVNYYQDLFKSDQANIDEVTNCVHPRLSSAQNMDLMKEISDVEVKSAIFQMHPDKAPGPDGMTPAFF
ncbi:uncharacterized protein LOC141716338 [Apium graveolens]|uniref:uncharacterized protein LOC141716338 n=1 Tax=Apium graveolens TaxID=4045 RepID=UPI003D7A1A82